MIFDSFFYRIKRKFLTILGDIEYHSYPFFLIYNPKHYALKGKHFEMVSKILQPYDVLLRRFDKYIDNKFIPGFWNHAGVCLPDKNIIHAIAEGVVKETLFDFMKADHLCVLRPKFWYAEKTLLERANKLLGKEYDFSFDFKNGDRLSCTELVKEFFHGFEHNIPLSNLKLFFFSREIIIPDTIYSANFKVVYDSRKAEEFES